MMATENLAPLKKQPEVVPSYAPDGDELKVRNQYWRRKGELLNSRKNVYGIDVDQQMRQMDISYFNRVANIPASELDPNQMPIAVNNAFGKIQAALSILIDRSPEISLEENNQRYSANRELIKGLAKSSWRNTNSLGQLKLSIFNCAKRGWFVGRTFHRKLKHDARFLKSIEEAQGSKEEKHVYDTKSITKVDDIAYMNINNFNAWIDEQTVPEDFYSTRDWMWREVLHIDDIRKMFPEDEFPNMKYVVEGGDTRETIEGTSYTNYTSANPANEAKETKKGMTEMFFYENQYDDWFIIEINGVMVVWEPLPQDSKRLSVVYGYWNLRGAESIYGIGVIEEMEKWEGMADRIMNMTFRQLLMTIAPPGFYTGTEDPEDANLKYTPGVLRRTLDPKSISWLQIPEGNKDGAEWLAWIENKEDNTTGITKTLEGDGGDKNSTAFETGVNREASLKRLRLPLKSIQYALDWEFRNRIDLIKQVYTDFEVEHISDPEDIQNYLDEVNADPAYYFIENEGQAGKEVFHKKAYREVQLNVEQDDEGNYVEADQKNFFHIKPDMLHFEGDVIVDIESMLVQSEELEKANTLRLANIIIPLVQGADPAKVGRAVKQTLLAFNKDTRKWLPDEWINAMNTSGSIGPSYAQSKKTAEEEAKKAAEQAQGGATGAGADGAVQPIPSPQTVVPQANLDGKMGIGSRMAAAFSAFKSPGNAGAGK
jgi:hypothetical protein